MTIAFLNRIATAVPAHEVHDGFIRFAAAMLEDRRQRLLFQRMAGKSGIGSRYSVMALAQPLGDQFIDAAGRYRRGDFPGTGYRMALYEQHAPALMRRAVDRLELGAEARRITHVIVTSCTGLYAPGLDFDVTDHLGLDPSTERTMVSFMGCYAAINALKLARHTVRSEPQSRILILNLELCTLHLQDTQDIEQVLSFLVFGDGAAASLVSAESEGLAIDSFRAVRIPDTGDLITWRVGDYGFDMMLSGRVPGEIGQAIGAKAAEIAGGAPEEIDLWAVHPGGRSVLDAVEQGIGLPAAALAPSREVLARYGNMSSPTVMFVLQSILESARPGQRGCAMAFGPGLTAETMLFHAA